MKFTGIDELDGLIYERDKVVARRDEVEQAIEETQNERTAQLLLEQLNDLCKLHLRLVDQIIRFGG